MAKRSTRLLFAVLWLTMGLVPLANVARAQTPAQLGAIKDSISAVRNAMPWTPPSGVTVMTSPESDCINAIPVCQSSYNQTASYPNYGGSQELSGTCLLNNEQKTVWYIFTVQNSGTFGFTLNTPNDYDFALFGPNASCGALGAPIRCNYSAQYGNTGLNAAAPAGGSISYNASQAPIMPGLNVVAGQTYILVIDNWTGNTNGYTLTFSGTASIFDNSRPSVTSVVQNCASNSFTVNFSEPIRCSSIQNADFVISGAGAPTVTGFTGCTGTYTNSVVVSYTAPASTAALTLSIADGAMQDICGNNIFAFSQGIGVLGPFTVANQSICPGGNVNLTGPAIPAGFTYLWSTGATTQTINVSPSATANYTLTIRHTASGCTRNATATVTVNPTPVVSVADNNIVICSGTASVAASVNPAAVNVFQWSFSGGAFGVNQSGTQNLPVGTHQVRAVVNGCLSNTVTVTVSSTPPSGSQACNVLYVSPTGSAAGDGTSLSPYDLSTALAASVCNGTIIKIAIGTYNITNPITNVTSFVTLEGGFDPSNGWRKTSQAGATVINRTNANVQGTGNQRRLVAFEISNATGFRFQDLTITTAAAPAATGAEPYGVSTYAVLMNGCANYNIVRCRMLPGAASAGFVGTAGAGYAQATNPGGGGGGAGSNTRCNGNGSAGGAGAAGSAGAAAGGGGGGCGGGGCNIFGCNASGCTGNTGGTGTAGAAGTTYAAGNRPATPTATTIYYQPAGQSADGTAGASGGGGGGGGGGDIGSCCTCGCGGGGTPNGGTGGAGGRGGNPGTGAYGGGGSFAAYLFNNGAGGVFLNVDATAAAGLGGDGGAGVPGQGGFGGAGGNAHGGCDGGTGGTGGTGGAGGNGGRGRDGANGLGAKMVLVSGSNVTYNGTAFAVNANGVNPVDFGLTTQPVIFASNIACLNTDLTYSTAAATPSWPNYGAGATPVSGAGASTVTQYTTLGRKNPQLTSDVVTTIAAASFTNNTAAAIADVATLDRTVNVAGLGLLGNPTTGITVSVNLTHTYTGDLTINLISPTGTNIQLFNRHGGGGDNIQTATFSMAAGTAIAAGAAPFNGTFIPVQSLNTFAGENPNGTWTLRIADVAGGDVGTFNSFTINFPSTSTTVAVTNTYNGFTNIISDRPTPSILPATGEICTGGSLAFSSPLQGTAGLRYSYTVTTGCGTCSSSPASPTAASTNSVQSLTFTNPTTTAQTFIVTLNITSECCGLLTPAPQTVVTVHPTPATPTVVNQGPLCVGSSATLTASAPAGASFVWWDAAVAGTQLSTSNSYTYTHGVNYTVAGTYTAHVQSISAEGCPSARVPRTATFTAPAAPVAINDNRCGPGTVDLAVVAVPGATYRWYDAPAAGTLLQTNVSNVFVTPVISITTTYYCSVQLPGCIESARTAVTATIGATTLVTWNGSVSTDWFTGANWTPGCVPSCGTDVIIPSAAGTPNDPIITPALANAGCRDITLNVGSILGFSNPNSTLDVCGNVTHMGAVQASGNGRFAFVGTTPQTYIRPIVVGDDFYTVVIDNPTGVTVDGAGIGHLEVATDGFLVFSQGIITTTGAAEVQVWNPSAASAVQNYAATRYVAGRLRRAHTGTGGNYDFPVGDVPAGKGYQLAQLQFAGANTYSDVLAYVTVAGPGAMPSYAECGNDGYDIWHDNLYWNLRATGAGAYNLRVYPTTFAPTVTGAGADYTPITGTRSATITKRANGGGAWPNPFLGTCVYGSDLNAGWVGRDGLNGFSEFAVAVDINTPFPVELLSLTATPDAPNIRLDWVTASESNNSGFTVQRRAESEVDFANIGWVAGHGTTTTEHAYQLLDRDATPGTRYQYRLEQRDLDGATTLSNVVEAMLPEADQFTVSLYPNPSDGLVNINYTLGANCCNLQIEVLDAAGRQVLRRELTEAGRAGNEALDLRTVADGIYNIRVTAGTQVETFRWVKQR